MSAASFEVDVMGEEQSRVDIKRPVGWLLRGRMRRVRLQSTQAAPACAALLCPGSMTVKWEGSGQVGTEVRDYRE